MSLRKISVVVNIMLAIVDLFALLQYSIPIHLSIDSALFVSCLGALCCCPDIPPVSISPVIHEYASSTPPRVVLGKCRRPLPCPWPR